MTLKNVTIRVYTRQEREQNHVHPQCIGGWGELPDTGALVSVNGQDSPNHIIAISGGFWDGNDDYKELPLFDGNGEEIGTIRLTLGGMFSWSMIFSKLDSDEYEFLKGVFKKYKLDLLLYLDSVTVENLPDDKPIITGGGIVKAGIQECVKSIVRGIREQKRQRNPGLTAMSFLQGIADSEVERLQGQSKEGTADGNAI